MGGVGEARLHPERLTPPGSSENRLHQGRAPFKELPMGTWASRWGGDACRGGPSTALRRRVCKGPRAT